jgi:hypothetical protein
MKKALIGFLILALSAGVFAQEEKEQGLQFGGALKTGILFQTSSEDGKYDPSIGLYNDDAGKETRLDLDGSYTKDNYGVVFRLRSDTITGKEVKDTKNETDFNIGPVVEVNQAYVWADFLGEIINVKLGKIDDSTWKTGGDEGFHYSTGSGLRLEVKPMGGLNVGFFLNGPNDSGLPTAKQNGNREVLSGILAKEFILETSFGAKYESDLFDFAAGLRIDSKADGLTTEEFYGHTTTNVQTGGDTNKGLGAYGGFAVKAVPNLTAAVEARFSNLGDYGKYGWIWINETLGYAITEQLEAGLVMHQHIFGGDNKFVKVKDSNNQEVSLKGDKSVSPYLKFKPYVSYALNDKWTVGLDIPVNLWIDIVDYDIGAKPKLSYQVGENAAISAFYLFNYVQHGDLAGNKDPKPDAIMANTVQIDFIWTF